MTETAEAFSGFSKEATSFLTGLGRKDRTWFQANRPTYERLLAEPAKAFVAAMTDELHEGISPLLVGPPKVNGSISPINNDLRFAKNAPAYKDHLLFRWWEGPTRSTAPTLFVRVSATEIGFATGAGLASIDTWRDAVAGPDGAALAAAIETLERGRTLDVAGRELKRVPTGYAPDHPRADLLRHKGFQARFTEPTPPEIERSDFVQWCADRLEACAEIHRWLVDHGI